LGNAVRFERRRWKGQPARLGTWRRPQTPWLLIGLIVAVVVGSAVAEFGFRAAGCNIKGNISLSGERIYHVPGQEYYPATRIDWRRGERWFCSEPAARKAGWRWARR
jgi:hypothetical protein